MSKALDLTQLSIAELQALTTDSTRMKQAVDRTIEYKTIAENINYLDSLGIGTAEFNKPRGDALFWVNVSCKGYRWSVECFPYTYDNDHRPFEYEGYNPDLHYRSINRAWSALYHAAQDQLDDLSNKMLQIQKDSNYSLRWSDIQAMPIGTEYRAIRESLDDWYKLMGFPGYWQNWQITPRIKGN